MRSFTTEGQTSAPFNEDVGPLKFLLDDVEYTALPPTETQFALMMAAMSDDRPTEEGIAAILDFFLGMFSPEEAAMLKQRLRDRDDPFNFQNMYDILAGVVEEWTERPTKPSNASTPSRPSTGRKSTAKPRSKAAVTSAS